ncbi:unnamed protein product [Caretta caretta]
MDAGPEAERGPAWGGCRPGGRLDMSHGFVRHIRRNQIARLDESMASPGRPVPAPSPASPSPSRSPRPHSPPHQGRLRPGDEAGQGEGRVDPACGLEYEGSSESSSSTEPDPRSTELFCLEYEADSGEVTSVIVHQDDSPEEVTEKVCAQSPLEPPLHEALRQRVQEELRKRRAKR